LDYFLFFFSLNHFQIIVQDIIEHARTAQDTWNDLSYAEYMLWIDLLSVMTAIYHSDRSTYWNQDDIHFRMQVNFSKYMSKKKLKDMMRMHVFEVYSIEKLGNNPFYHIRSTLHAFCAHMKDSLIPGKYLVIDESMTQRLGVGMLNVKEVPRDSHPIGQEFKSLPDYHTNCIIRLDTVSDHCPKEYDNEPGMSHLLATVKRLVKLWFGSGKTVIADSWFGSP
jgi:hypothetical protein